MKKQLAPVIAASVLMTGCFCQGAFARNDSVVAGIGNAVLGDTTPHISGYKNLDNYTKASFDYDLNDFVVDNGQSPNPGSYVPYSKRAQFAYGWLLNHVTAYGSMRPPAKRDMIYAAIVDGNTLYWNGWGRTHSSSSGVMMHEAEMRGLMQKSERI